MRVCIGVHFLFLYLNSSDQFTYHDETVSSFQQGGDHTLQSLRRWASVADIVMHKNDAPCADVCYYILIDLFRRRVIPIPRVNIP